MKRGGGIRDVLKVGFVYSWMGIIMVWDGLKPPSVDTNLSNQPHILLLVKSYYGEKPILNRDKFRTMTISAWLQFSF